MKKSLLAAAVIAAALFTASSVCADEAYVGPVKDYLASDVKAWVNDPAIIDAIKAQNAEHANLSQGDIDGLDQKWRAEVDADAHPTIDAVLAKPISAFLKAKQEGSDGTITEVFVMDDKGLNVGQSAITSDYWQGDEAKFKKSFGAGADSVFVDEAEKDESTQMLQSQASMTISDENGKPIGAVTIGINLDKL